MTIHIVAARSKNNIIGRGLEIPWRVKGEQKLFKDITLGGTLIMGRLTFESVGRALPGRTTIIITRDVDYHQDDCIIAHGLDQAINLAHELGNTIYIAGGGEIYRQALPLTDMVHLTTIDLEVEGNVSFPDFPTAEFEKIGEQFFESNIDYIHQKYKRIKEN